MLCDGFCHTVEHPFQVIQFPCLLYFHEYDFIIAVACLNVHTVELVVAVILVALALQNLDDVHRFVDQYSYESLKHAEVSLVAQHALGGPVKSDISVVVFHIVAFLWQTYEKKTRMKIMILYFYHR